MQFYRKQTMENRFFIDTFIYCITQKYNQGMWNYLLSENGIKQVKIVLKISKKCFSINGNFKTYSQYDLKIIIPPVEKTPKETIRNTKQYRKVNNYFYWLYYLKILYFCIVSSICNSTFFYFKSYHKKLIRIDKHGK